MARDLNLRPNRAPRWRDSLIPFSPTLNLVPTLPSSAARVEDEWLPTASASRPLPVDHDASLDTSCRTLQQALACRFCGGDAAGVLASCCLSSTEIHANSHGFDSSREVVKNKEICVKCCGEKIQYLTHRHVVNLLHNSSVVIKFFFHICVYAA